MVNDERLTQALKFLVDTDESAAKAKALVEGLGEQRKTIKAIGFLDAKGTKDERESKAYTTDDYKKLIERYENAVVDFEYLRNKRITESLIVEVWRTESANRRSGNV